MFLVISMRLWCTFSPLFVNICWNKIWAISGMSHAGDRCLFSHKQFSIANNLSVSPSHHPDMTEILLKKCKIMSRPSKSIIELSTIFVSNCYSFLWKSLWFLSEYDSKDQIKSYFIVPYAVSTLVSLFSVAVDDKTAAKFCPPKPLYRKWLYISVQFAFDWRQYVEKYWIFATK